MLPSYDESSLRLDAGMVEAALDDFVNGVQGRFGESRLTSVRALAEKLAQRGDRGFLILERVLIEICQADVFWTQSSYVSQVRPSQMTTIVREAAEGVTGRKEPSDAEQKERILTNLSEFKQARQRRLGRW